ncbi:hypothetical protein L915_04789 [Phytophthora nicotianae]|uniref:Uncharacterized protein n=1 Tax=Phytophthora nicotianae TaxID=4792 RepID=W2H983_PHYNI|nr:hypothetical protein L915_04789 [Phytophthora nicotianae]
MRRRDKVAAALADVQARQESLARGSVLSRASSPSPSASASAALSPPPLSPPVSRNKAQRATASFQWLKRRVVRRSESKESDVLEDLGSLDLVSSASLASVRALIGQFIALPPRREFAFVHPTTNAPVAVADESDIYARNLPFICLVLLPVKEPAAGRGTSIPLVSAVATRRRDGKEEQRRPETAHIQQQQEEKQLRPRTVAAGANRATATVIAPASAVVSSELSPVSAVKGDRGSPDGVKTGRERHGVFTPVREERKQIETDAVPLQTPTKPMESTREKRILDNKRASSANLPERLKPSHSKMAGQDTTDKQMSELQGHRTSVRVASAGSGALVIPVEEKLAASFIPETSPAVQEETEFIQSSPSIQRQARENITPHQVDSSDATIADLAPKKPSSPGKSVYQTPGHLRRSRRFKGLTAAKLAEKSWECEDPEEQEVITDAELEEFLRSLLRIIRTGLEGVDARQLDEALSYYGVDYRALKLNGVLLGLDTELGMRCIHVRGGVDGQLKQYLLKIFPVDKENSVDPEDIQRFEFALNIFAGMRGWISPTKLRASYFEEKHPLQFIPASDSRRLAFLRLSDRDHQLFALASSDDPTVQLESWLADGMEITYVLMYGFLQSRRNSEQKPLIQLEAHYLRRDRVQATIQKLTSVSFDVWKRLEFCSNDIDDTSMVRRLNELTRTFLQDSKLYCGDLVGSAFFPALVGYLSRKKEQLAQSLFGILPTSGVRGAHHTSVLEYLRLLRQYLEQPETDSASCDSYLQSVGLKIIDVDKINASRSSAGLGRLYVNGRESALTHYQCNLMANDSSLLIKARWEHQELREGTVSRYCFHGTKEIAVEYVFVRTKLFPSAGNDMRWEDRDRTARKEAQHAFVLICGDSLEVPENVAIGVGINIIHAELLPRINSMTSLSTVLREYSGATSISFGYCYTPVDQAVRVAFRVHTDTSVENHGYISGSSGCWGLPSAIIGIDRFLKSAQEEEAIAFCEADGLRFLNSFLRGLGDPWTTTKYGKPFFDYIYEKKRDDTASLRGYLLRAMKRTIAIIPCVPQSITKTNINIIVQIMDNFPDMSDVVDEVIGVLMAICSSTQEPKGSISDYFAPRMTENQKQFTTQSGLEILKDCTAKLQGIPAYKEAVETVILCLLMTHEMSATKAGLLFHWHDWFEYYIENGAWTTHPAESAFLLKQVHAHFFASTAILKPEVEKCPCGCDRRLVEFVEAFVGLMKLFVRLMLTGFGVTWAQLEMHGPRDCVSFLLWSAHPSRWIPSMDELQKLIVSSLCEFMERLTSSHQYLRALSELTAPLIELLCQQDCTSTSLHTGALRVLSLTFRLAIDKKVWSISMEIFLESFYQLLETICGESSCSDMNRYMNDVLFNAERSKQSASSSTILSLLHEEHMNFVGGSSQLSPVSRSQTKSLLQTLVSLCSLTWNSVLQPFCQIPALLNLGWMLTSSEIAGDLAQLEVDDGLLSLMENESVVVSISAARAYTIFLFQGLQSRRVIAEYRLKKLCNLLTTVLASSSRLILSPKRSSNSENSDIIQFVANQPDAYSILMRYKDLNRAKQSQAQQKELDQDDATTAGSSPVEVFWELNERNDLNRAMADKLANHLKLLIVLSSMTRNIVSIGSSDEIREIIFLLVRFVRERVHSASPHITLYLLSLRNLIWATRPDIMKWGISDLTEPPFLRKLLILAKDKLHQELATGILWGLVDAYEKSNIPLLLFEVDDAVATGSYFAKKIGFAVLVDNLVSKMTANRSIENDCGAMASMIANPVYSHFFLTNYGYPFVLKTMESILRLLRAGYTHGSFGPKGEDKSMETTEDERFGPMLFYSYAIENPHERELLQLCRSAVNVLEAMQRISPESVLDEAARTKTTMLPLLDYPNKLVAQYAVMCCSIHLQTHPPQCGKLLGNDVLDKVIANFFDEFPPLQVAAFSCIKLAFADQKNLSTLQSKLFPLRQRIVSCLHSPAFEVKRKAILLLVEAVFRLEDQTFLDGFAEAFVADNNGLLMELFDSVSKEVARNSSAGGVLQLLVRLVLKLNLVARTGGDKLAHVICHMLKTHSNDTFLRPVLFNFLLQIVSQDDHAEYFDRKSRLDVVTELLSQRLTLSELRNVANILILAASKHSGIRHYLSGFESGCIPKVASLLGEFSEHSLDIDNSKRTLPVPGCYHEDRASGIQQPEEMPDEGSTTYLLKITTSKTVFASHFTEDIYELFLRLLLLLVTGPEFSAEERYGCLCESDGCSNCDPCDIIAKARYGTNILRFSAARRVMCPTYDLSFLLSAKGDPADSILSLTIQVTKQRQESVAHTIQLLGHLSAAKEVAQRLMMDRPFISTLFSYLTPTDQSIVAIRRTSAFTLARLAELPVIVRDAFFQEKMALVIHASKDNDDQLSNPERDPLVLANRMILARNQRLLTPGLQGRSIDEGLLSVLVHLLVSHKMYSQEVGVLAGDVLANLLYYRVTLRDKSRFRSVIWSPTKSTEELNHSSSKRLTAYLHNSIKLMLQKLRQSSFGAFREYTAQLLNDELAYTCKHLEETTSGRELLCVLISLHLPSSGTDENLINNHGHDLSYSDSDVIQTYNHVHRTYLRPRSLQYVFSASDRSTHESNDYSFNGSSHLWLFLRKLWNLAIAELEEDNEQNRASISEVKDTVASRIPYVFTSWNSESDVRYSTVAFERRRCFLDFVIAVGKWDPSVLNVIDTKTIVEIVIRNGIDAPATMGREYLLLKEMCQHIPENIVVMAKCFGLDCMNNPQGKPSDVFRVFWSSVHLQLLPVKFTLAAGNKITILDPSTEAELVLIFGIDVLKLLSSSTPPAVKWYAECQGDTEVLDMMLLASKTSTLQMQHSLVRSFLSSLLWLTNQLLELDHATYLSIFTSDPRYLRCVIDLIYAPAHEVQTSAIKLLQNLAQQPRIFAMLSRLDSVTDPIGTVNSDVVSYVGKKLNKYLPTPPLSQDCVVLLAHISFVPFFTDLNTTELVKLSLGFRQCRHPESHCWTILVGDGRFSSVPEWMIAQYSKTSMTSFAAVMQRIQKRFDGFVGALQDKANFSMYAIDQKTYITHTSVATRRRVAVRLNRLLKTYIDDSAMCCGSLRARNGLVVRLGRLLVEVRAEIIRRVAYTKRISERVVFEQMQTRQLSDLLLLLQESPLFEGVPRDILANVAFRLGNPLEFPIYEPATMQHLPLLLVFDESVEFEMHLAESEEVVRGTVTRGGLLGYPHWLQRESSNTFAVHKCGLLGAIISLEVLESELPEPALNIVNNRLSHAYADGDVQAILRLMSHDNLPVPTSGKRHLQCSASALIVQLITADAFVESLLNDNWAIGVLVDVALGALPADVVLNALTVIAALTETETRTKRFWTKLTESGNAKEIVTSLWHPVAEFVNRFKLRLWENHPEILERFFLIQSQVASSVPAFWTNLQSTWTVKYLRDCVALLRSDQKGTPEVVGYHLSCGIPHRVDFLLRCGYDLDLHLTIARALARTRSGNVIGMLQLFDALSNDEVLCEQIWEHVIISSDVFDGILELVTAEISGCFDAGSSNDLEVYCTFIYKICTGGIKTQLDLGLRHAIQNQFGILLVLLEQVHELRERHSVHVVLRCVGSICTDTRSNYNLAAASAHTDEKTGSFISIVVTALAELESHLQCHTIVESLEIQAIFSCIDAITSVSEQSEHFESKNLMTIALNIIQLFASRTQTFDDGMIVALQSVVKVLRRVVSGEGNDYLQALNEAEISTFVAGYELNSQFYSMANDNIQLLRLLESYTTLLDVLVTSQNFLDMLWTMYFNGTEASSSFLTWMYQWILFEPNESPSINALNLNRASKRDRVLAVASKMQTLSLSVAIRLTEHHSIVQELTVHPKFSGVIAHICASLHNATDDIDFERPIQWVKFMCFLLEKWEEATSVQSDGHRMSAVKAALAHVKISLLLQACVVARGKEESFVCYAIRFLWLLVKLQNNADNFVVSVDRWTDEWIEVIHLAIRILQLSSSSMRLKCYLLGLLAELTLNQVTLTTDTSEVVDLVHATLKMLTGNLLLRETVQNVASRITTSSLSAHKWKENNEGSLDEELIGIGVILQSQRFVLYLSRVPYIRTALFHSESIHPLMCRTLFQEAIATLGVKRDNELWITAQEDSLHLITTLLRAADEVGRNSVLRSYRLVARRGHFLKSCIDLLSEPWKLEFQCVIVEGMRSYLDKNIGGSAEVVALREHGDGDLMELLRSIIVAEDTMDGSNSSNIIVLCLRLFNSVIEFSLENARYAARRGFSELCRKFRVAASRHGALIWCDRLRTIYFIVRMVGDVDQSLTKEIWEISCAYFLHPLLISHTETTKYALEILRCHVGKELGALIALEWDDRGRHIALCLINLLHNATLNYTASESDASTAKLSVGALVHLCCSDTLSAYIANDPEIVTALVRGCEHPKNKGQFDLLNVLLASEDAILKKSFLSEQLLDQLGRIATVNSDCRVLLLDLLPGLIHILRDRVVDSGGKCWNDLLLCVLEELSSHTGKPEADESRLVIATKSLINILDACDCRDFPSELLFRLHDSLLRIVDTSRVICDPNVDDVKASGSGYFQDFIGILVKSSPLELLVLSSLTKLSAYLEIELPVQPYGIMCVSSWVNSSVCCNCEGGDTKAFILSSLAMPFLAFCGHNESLQPVFNFPPYWRILTRMFATFHGEAVHLKVSKMMLQLLREPTSDNYRSFVSNICKLDLIEVLWWDVSTKKNNVKVGQRELWYSLLFELCYNRSNALAIMEREFLERFVVLESDQLNTDLLQEPASTSFLRLVSSVLRATNFSDHAQCFEKAISAMDILAELCICTIASILKMNETKWNATEVLYALAMHQQTLPGIWKACRLYPLELSDEVSERLCAVSEMLLQCGKSLADLILVLTIVVKICGQSIDILIRARNMIDCWPMVSVLVEVLQQCLHSSTSSSSYLRPIVLTTSNPVDFLPFHFPTEFHIKATVLALQLVQLCASDCQFAESLETELDLLRTLFMCIATSNLEVANNAAIALSALIRCDVDCYDPEDEEADVTRYMCSQGDYRHLEFFYTLDTQEIVRVAPSSRFPPSFVLLVRWLRFYSVNLTLLSDVQEVEHFTQELETTEITQRDDHEKFVASILEILLYSVSNYHFVVYKNDNGESEEQEHSFLLQSLLSLCQRCGGLCIVSSSQIRSRSLTLVQLLCSLDLPHTSSVQVFTNPQQMQILMMIVECSTSDAEQNAAAQLIQALALKEPVKTLLICDSLLLFRLESWLEMDTLQLLAAAVIQRLATLSSIAVHGVFGFYPSAQQQLAQFLFVGLGHKKPNSEFLKENKQLLCKFHRFRLEIHLDGDAKCSPRQSSFRLVQMRFEIVDQSGKRLRQFEYQATLQSGNESGYHEFLVDPAARIVRCNVFTGYEERKFEFSRGIGSVCHRCDSVQLRFSEEELQPSTSSTGILARLLRQDISVEFFQALSGIVAEFCKDYSIFRDPIVDLPFQILVVLARSVEFPPIGQMDVMSLENLTTWFPTKPTVSNFKAIIPPVLNLIQKLRQLVCVSEVEHESVLGSDSGSSSFLEKIVELVGDVEIRDLTANTLNTLFIENSDLLLCLCGQFNSEQSSETTFLSLVASAIRRNVVHCQTFLTPTAQTLLRSVFDAGIQKSTAQPELRSSLIYFASLVIVRLTRCPIGDNLMNALDFFSRISFEMFSRHPTADEFSTGAVENLILSCSFFFDGLPTFVAVHADTREFLRYEALFSASNVAEDELTIAETLLMFLGRTPSNGIDTSGVIDGQISYDSYDRLAASILEALVEKLSSRKIFEQTFLQLLDSRYQQKGKTIAKAFEEQCLVGMRKCIDLTRYDFQSELNALRLTYYSSIRAGVRTGIIPPQCSGVFQRFDQEHLLPSESLQWHKNQIGESEKTHRHRSFLRHEQNLATSPSKFFQAEDSKFDLELRELILFTNEHSELLSVLTVNRKKALTSAIRVATQNARVLMAFHSMASLALDFYIDTAMKLQNEKKKTKRNYQRRMSAIVNIGNDEQKFFLEWLLLLEQLAGLLCSGLHELDATYYIEIARQFRSLILDLPIFLRKIERMGTHSRQQALMLFLDNLHRLLKRATNRNELRVVAANGSGIVDQTKPIRERLRKLDVHISTSLAALLESKEGMDNLSRMLIAMQYMWRRIMGDTSLEKTMASSREAVSILKKMKEKFMSFIRALRRPMTTFRARHKTSTVKEFDGPSELLNLSRVINSASTGLSSQSISERDDLGATSKNFRQISSPFPFASFKLLLDHIGLESITAKRTKLLLQSPKNKNVVIGVLTYAFGMGEEAVERMTTLELAEKFHELEEKKKVLTLLDQLQQLTLENEMPFDNLPSVSHDKVEMSLWRLMVRPIQRVRFIHLYHQAQIFVHCDPTKRRVILETYCQASPQRPIIRNRTQDELSSEEESRTKQLVAKPEKDSAFSRFFGTLKKEKQRIGADQIVQEEPVQIAAATGPWNTAPSLKAVISRSTLKVCDGIFNPDPFSDDSAMVLLRRKLEAQTSRRNSKSITRFRESNRSAQYRYDQHASLLDRILHGIILIGARLILLIAFWRQEELRMDLKDPIMAKAFNDPHARDEYYRFYHAKKGLGELVRVWMPTSGRLGLQLWQERYYALIGSLFSVVISLWLPTVAFDDDVSKRNIFMTRIVYGYGIGIFLLSVVSIALIAQNRFVLLEQTRLRLRPVSRYYQNALAVTAIAVELVQLNSLTFDSAVEWDDSDELPAIIEWLGNQGITKFGFTSVSELEALGVLLLLLFWFLLLKCANKFRETSALLHRILTKDLPALVHGFLYMSTISVFFSYLACMDCSDKHASKYEKCNKDPNSPPFLIAHKDITCWTSEHQWYALLGLWGITFFLPIGLLAHGMSQVLFQRETLDIKYAPVLILVVQLVKAAAATAQGFFPHNPILLASLGAVGNAVLLVLTLAMHSCSLWYIKYIKCSIYAASCWASLGAIHRLQYTGQSSTRSLNMIYFGWLSIGLTTATAILVKVWLRARAKQRDTERHFAAQQRLLNAGKASGVLGTVEQKFMKAASKRCTDPLTRAAFISNAKRLSSLTPPPVLEEFVARAKDASVHLNEPGEILIMQNARILAKKLREHAELRRRR